jgi:hypothetical protein
MAKIGWKNVCKLWLRKDSEQLKGEGTDSEQTWNRDERSEQRPALFRRSPGSITSCFRTYVLVIRFEPGGDTRAKNFLDET